MTICSRKTGHPNGGCAVSDCSRWTPASEKSFARKTTCTQSSNEVHRAIKLESSARFKIFWTRRAIQTRFFKKWRLRKPQSVLVPSRVVGNTSNNVHGKLLLQNLI